MNTNTGNMKVLVVDDMEKNLQLIGNLLSEKGISILMATDGKKAINAVINRMPDLILLDIAMPEMDGYEVCEQLKQNEETSGIPIIFLTAKNEPEDIVKGFAYGAVDYITKPFNKEELISRVFTHLELKVSRDIIAEQKQNLVNQNVKILEHSKKVEELNDILNDNNRKLKELNATKDKFFSIIGHDLKNPLISIINFTKILTSKIDVYEKEKILEISNSLLKTTETSYKLLENLLHWARSQTGEIKQVPKSIELYSLIKENTKLFSKLSESKNISFSFDNLHESYVLADENMINTVIRNLISNAIKFTPKGGMISYSSKNVKEKNRELVEITVADTGIGMTEKQLSDLFTISKKNISLGTEGEKGTGLGLILCKDFIERNKGKIWAESKPHNGSMFKFTIPAQTI